jgi:hypothetical protein
MPKLGKVLKDLLQAQEFRVLQLRDIRLSLGGEMMWILLQLGYIAFSRIALLEKWLHLPTH